MRERKSDGPQKSVLLVFFSEIGNQKEKLGISEDIFRISNILKKLPRKREFERKIIKEEITNNKKPCTNTNYCVILGL